MADKPVLYGFDGSTYVRSVRTLLHAKGVEYDQVPVNVLEGEPREAEHLARHPFGKVPVLDIDGLRLLETAAILRYVDESRDGPSYTPESARDRARMTMQMGLVDSYGYGALLGCAGYHLFPDFLGNPSEAQHRATQETARRYVDLAMDKKAGDPFLAGEKISQADLLLGPIVFYLALTPEKDELLGGRLGEWWARFSEDKTFRETEPDLG